MGTMHTYRHFILAVSTLLVSHAACAQSTREASELLAQGKAKAAYELLLSEEAAHAGNPDFDYLLGRSALDSGEFAKATLIFERVLAVAPNHAGARLDMGRAYFALGDFPRARSEFESLQTLNPPPAARATIAQYLSAIEQQGKLTRSRFSAYTELSIGHDSNVTTAPSGNTVFLPLFGMNFTLGEAARARSDSYHQVSAGGEIIHAIDNANAVFAAADLRYRNYGSVNHYDQRSGELRGGWIHTRGADTYRLFVSWGDLNLGHEGYRHSTSIGADWRRRVHPRAQLSAFAQTTRLRYVQDQMEGNDYNQTILGSSWSQQFGPQGGLTLAATLFLGQEKEVRQRTDGNKHFLGLRGGLMWNLSPELDLYSGLTFQHGKYQRENILYQEHRKDKQTDLMLGLNWRFSPGWTLRPHISTTRNRSNTSISSYRRNEASITLRKDF